MDSDIPSVEHLEQIVSGDMTDGSETPQSGRAGPLTGLLKFLAALTLFCYFGVVIFAVLAAVLLTVLSWLLWSWQTFFHLLP